MRVKCRVTSSQSETLSDYHTVNYGTPQGSCLGPLIFLIFVNDMRLHLTDVDSVQFANDTTIVFGHPNENYLKYCVERELAILGDWFRANKLTLNVDKSVFLMFNRKGQGNINQLKLGDSLIDRVSTTKFLGVWLDDQLNWKTHLNKLLSKLKCGLGMLQRSKELLSYKAKKLLYYGQVQSHLCYGLGVWGPMLSPGQITQLCTIQRKCVRMIDSSVPTSEAFKKLQILTVSDMINLEQGKLGNKLCNGLLPSVLTRLMMHDFNNCTIVKNHSYKPRQKDIPNRPNAKLNLYRKSFLYQAIACYSKLDKKLRDSPTIFSFSKKLKKSMISN